MITSTAAPRNQHRTVVRAWPVVAAILVAAAVYGGAVWTSAGQLLDQLVLDINRSMPALTSVPSVLVPEFVDNKALWALVAVAVIVLASVPLWATARPRLPHRHEILTVAALLAFPPAAIVCAQTLRDHVLIRPVLHEWITETTNSAPSGHAAAVTAVTAVLIVATPPRFRVWTATAVGSWAVIIEFGLIAAGWHRLSDVVISTVLVAGFATLLPDPYRGTTRFTGTRHSHLLPALIPVTGYLVSPCTTRPLSR